MIGSTTIGELPIGDAPSLSTPVFGSVAFVGRGLMTVRPRTITQGAAAFVGTGKLYADLNLRIYAATREFITEPSDTLANQPFRGTLQKVIRFDRSIINGGRIGQVTAGWGEIELTNPDGYYDDLIAKYAVDGRRVVVKIGVVGLPYNGFVTLFDGTAANWQIDEDVLRVQVRDNTYRLEQPAQKLLYGGAGGLDGTSDLKGKRMPLALGEIANATPVFLVPNLLVYQVSSGPVQAIPAVYDKGAALVYAGDFATPALLLAATTGPASGGAQIEAGRYGTCLAAGLIRLGGASVGQITCDVQGDKTGGTYVGTTADIIRRLIARSTDIADPGGLITPSFATVNAAQPAVIGYYLDGSRDASVADVIADLMGGIGGWGGMRRNGRFELGIFTAPSGAPVASYSQIDLVEPDGIKRMNLPEGLSPPPYRFRIAWGRNWTVQTDVAGSVTAARTAFLQESRRLATSNVQNALRTDHPLAQDPEPIEAYFRDEADALAEANRLLTLFGASNSLYRLPLKVRPFTHEIGDVIQMTYPRWDLKDGRLLRLAAVTDDADDDQIDAIGFG